MSSLLGSHSKSKSVQESVANSQQTSASNSDTASLANSVSNSNSTATSHTGNQAYGALSDAFAPVMGQTAQSGDFISQLLGLKGDAGANDAFQKYLGSTGYQFNLNSGSNAITGNAAAKGLLNSGSTLKALSDYGQNTGASYFNNFLQQLLGLGKQGTDAGSLLAGAGGVSDSNSVSNTNSTSNSGTVSSSNSVGQGTSGSVSSGVSGSESGSGIGGFTGILLNNLMGKGVG
jgi:hypothetical protein